MTTDSKIIAHKAYVLDILIDFIERYQDNLINNDVDEDIITYNSFVYALMYECNFEFGGDPLFFPVTLSFQRYEVSFSISANSKGVEFLVMRECKIVCVNRYCMNLLYAPYWGKQR